MQRDIVHRFDFPQSPELVWEYLTQADLLSEWLMPNDFKLELGHKFEFGTKPKTKLGFDGRVYCEVLEFEAPKKLVYSWRGGLSKENPLLDSIVIWTLIPNNGGTTLQLEHKGFKGMKNLLAYIIMGKGWLKIGKRLGSKLAMQKI